MESSKATLEKIILTVGELPSSPAIVSALMGLTSDLDSNVDEVSKTLSADQSLTAKVLKLSNSPFYGRPKGVGSVEEAILILGFFTVRSMVIASSAHRMYIADDKYGHADKLWRHSLSTAVAARQIAKYIKHPEKEELFIAALLHDIGKLVLMQKLPDQYRQVVEKVEETQSRFIDIELQELGFTHCDIAVTLLEKWAFPEGLINAVHRHHLLPKLEEDQPIPLAYLINIGNFMSKKMGLGFSDYKVDNLAELDSAAALKLDESTLDDIYEEFLEHYQIEVRIIEGK